MHGVSRPLKEVAPELGRSHLGKGAGSQRRKLPQPLSFEHPE